ncbi:MAG: Stp1/IreP family PP2C-type Ser/Thr phosphatase [Ruminococcaceae bacterium]|nr:Stp1/IreP family PP2C-type Ser/Thr phosphatase [Oscillospiraceae bacterium]
MLHYEGYTDVGQTRPINEDSFCLSEYSREMDAAYVIVADGMGGHQAGEVASSMAIAQISDTISQGFMAEMASSDIKELLVQAIKKANSVVYEKGQSEEGCWGMGTTVTMCFVIGERAFIANVGDSRAYLLRNGLLHQITVDHSLVQELLQKGQITEEEAANHPQKNVITRALGTDSGVEIDLYEFTLCDGDMMLLCTDGLSNMLSNETLTRLLQEKNSSLYAVAEKLVMAANEAGGYDNITAVVLTKESGLGGKE